jgi:hypothetical protein
MKKHRPQSVFFTDALTKRRCKLWSRIFVRRRRNIYLLKDEEGKTPWWEESKSRETVPPSLTNHYTGELSRQDDTYPGPSALLHYNVL